MRELKFRVWDKIGNLFLPEATGGSINQKGELILNFAAEHTQDKNNFVIQQSTGLKDKNGVEIYEGDIVLAHTPYHQNEIYDEIIFSEGCFRLKELEYTIDTIDFEHFGNIFENSDLLK